MIETVDGLRTVPISLSGGVDEVSPADAQEPGDAVKFTNWRLSKDGKRIQKRAGLQEEYTAFGEDVYGLSTYFNSSSQFCQIAVLESQVMRKVAAGAWTNIFSFSGNIDHVVKPLEISGKQFIITEKGSRVIHADGNIRQIGITAPTAMPTAEAQYTGAGTPPINDYMTYANQPAMDAVWTSADAFGASSLVSGSDPDGVPGPDADQKYMRLNSSSVALAYAQRYRQATIEIPNIYSAEFYTYFDTLSANVSQGAGFSIHIDNGEFDLHLQIAKDGVWLVPRNEIKYRLFSDAVPLNKHIKWNVSVDGTDLRAIKVDVFCTYDDLIKASGNTTAYLKDSTYANRVTLQARCGILTTYGPTDAYVDHVIVRSDTIDSAKLTGVYRYAVSFLREGDYGCESNPIKSATGTIAFAGSGLNDMTLNDETSYTGGLTKDFLVKIKTAASPQDTIQWSNDNGQTWLGELKLSTKVHLGYGLVVNFGAITGHVAGDSWTIPCYACSAIATLQQITVSGIPTSSDEQVTARKLYRTTSTGAAFYYLTTIYDRATTTEFVDNFPDATLGREMEEDRDLFTEATIGTGTTVSTTIGKFSEYWDDRLWVADHVENVIYYSAVRSGGGIPEEFDFVSRFIPIKRGVQGDVITGMKAYKDALYVFKRNDIFIIQKNYVGYGVFHLNSDVGCVADGCIEQVNDFLMFPSERGLEIYDGVKPYSPEFSMAVNKTYLAADTSGYKYWSIVHDKEFNEVWLSIPSSNVTIVWNYIRNKFYFFEFYKVPSCLVSCKNDSGRRVVKMGTRDGYLDLCDYGTADHTTVITATYRKGWLDMQAHGIGRLLKTDYELPDGKTITMNVYVNMEKDVFRTAALTGVTPDATDIDIRRIIGDKTELGVRARWMSVEYINAEDCGGDCKINEAAILVRPDVIKRKTYAD